MEIRSLDAKQWQAHWQLTNAIASVKQESSAFKQTLAQVLQDPGVESVATSNIALPQSTQQETGSDLADLLLKMIKLGKAIDS